jgi:hypothetical protein
LVHQNALEISHISHQILLTLRVNPSWHSMTDAEAADLEILRTGARPWVPVKRLNGALDALVASGDAEVWSADKEGRPLEGGPFACLTPLGAERLNLRLYEVGDAGPPKWGYIDFDLYGHPWPLKVHWFDFFEKKRWHRVGFPEGIEDPNPGPLQQLIDAESGEPVTLFGTVPVMVDVRDLVRRKPKRKKKRRNSGG